MNTKTQNKQKKDTVFGKIIRGELPCEKVYEDERILVIKDIHPVAPVHLLLMPKKAISCLQEVSEKDLPLIMEIVKIAQKLAKEHNIEDGYRLVTNCGRGASQTVAHLHFHLIGGKNLTHGLG